MQAYPPPVEDTRAVHDAVARHRDAAAGPFDLVVPGESPAGRAREAAEPHGAAGGTWWQENLHAWRFGGTAVDPLPAEQILEQITAGP